MYGFWHFPLNGSVWGMIIGMMLLVAASQAFALFITCLIPNLRFALSILSLTGILSFSIAGFSFPVEEMYFCRWEYVYLILFLLPPVTMLWKLKRISLNPVYIP